MVNAVYLAIANHYVSLPIHDGRYQVGNKTAGILIIGIGIDDDVGAGPQTGIKAILEGSGQSQVLLMAHDMVDAQ